MAQIGTLPTVCPFQTRMPAKPSGLQCARVGKGNLPELAYHITKVYDKGVWIPADRQCIQVGDKRFFVGEWMVVDDGGVRHPTEEETVTYGLDPLETVG